MRRVAHAATPRAALPLTRAPLRAPSRTISGQRSRVYTDRPNTAAELTKQLKVSFRGETDEQERTRLRKVLQAIESPIVLTQDAYIGRGDTVADVALSSTADAGLDAADDLLLPPERIPPMPLLPRQREPSGEVVYVATGRRKTSTATVMLVPVVAEEHATVLVNNKELPDYFPSYRGRDLVLDPLLLTERLGQFKALIRVAGGGFMSQASAARLAMSRALERFDPDLRHALKTAGFLMRDPRMVERKKPGKAKARKSFTWHKR